MGNVKTNTQTTALAVVNVRDTKNECKWVLTLKNNKTKEYKNVVFYTNDVKVAHKYIDEVRQARVWSFVSLASTDRVQKYIYSNEVTKLFTKNLKAINDRSKGTIDTKKMFTQVVAAINCKDEVVRLTSEGVNTIEVKYK